MPKTKPKIWEEWKRENRGLRYSLIPSNHFCFFVYKMKKGWTLSFTDWDYFKTKEAAMLKAQSLILKEFRKIQQVMRDKI